MHAEGIGLRQDLTNHRNPATANKIEFLQYNTIQNSMHKEWAFNINDDTSGIKRKLAEGINTRIFFGEQVMVSVVEFAPNSKGTIHNHAEEQWGMLLKGSLKRVQGGEIVDMKVGDFWLTPSNVPHTIYAGENGATVLDIFSPIRKEYTKSGEGFGEQNVDK